MHVSLRWFQLLLRVDCSIYKRITFLIIHRTIINFNKILQTPLILWIQKHYILRHVIILSDLILYKKSNFMIGLLGSNSLTLRAVRHIIVDIGFISLGQLPHSRIRCSQVGLADLCAEMEFLLLLQWKQVGGLELHGLLFFSLEGIFQHRRHPGPFFCQ